MKIKEAKFDMDSNHVYAVLDSGDNVGVLLTNRDRMVSNALLQKLVEEH